MGFCSFDVLASLAPEHPGLPGFPMVFMGIVVLQKGQRGEIRGEKEEEKGGKGEERGEIKGGKPSEEKGGISEV